MSVKALVALGLGARGGGSGGGPSPGLLSFTSERRVFLRRSSPHGLVGPSLCLYLPQYVLRYSRCHLIRRNSCQPFIHSFIHSLIHSSATLFQTQPSTVIVPSHLTPRPVDFTPVRKPGERLFLLFLTVSGSYSSLPWQFTHIHSDIATQTRFNFCFLVHSLWKPSRVTIKTFSKHSLAGLRGFKSDTGKKTQADDDIPICDYYLRTSINQPNFPDPRSTISADDLICEHPCEFRMVTLEGLNRFLC